MRLAEGVQPLPERRRVRLFGNGRNQTVYIPVEFELPGKEAIMHREFLWEVIALLLSLPAQTNRRPTAVSPVRILFFCPFKRMLPRSSYCVGQDARGGESVPEPFRAQISAIPARRRSTTEDLKKPLCKAPAPSDDNSGTLTLNDCQHRSVRGCLTRRKTC
jgi:hypothetical protein